MYKLFLMVSALVIFSASVGYCKTTTAYAYAPVTGAIFTTTNTCGPTNQNIFANPQDVYLNGGPTHPGAAGLPDGYYYVQVTAPDGTVLGTSGVSTPVYVLNGEFSQCYQLWSLVKTPNNEPGYLPTPNPGGEYKVWVSTDPSFANSNTKTDNFKVKLSDTEPPKARLIIVKYYDVNANEIRDSNEPYLIGWKVSAEDGIIIVRFTKADVQVDPDDYVVKEFLPLQLNWIPTTATQFNLTIGAGETKVVEFGNVCVGSGGGKTLGFWSNKNGAALINDGNDGPASELALLSGLNLRNADGSNFDPTTVAQLQAWLLSANATNMANMLSAQLAAMRLNVEAGLVNKDALIYSPTLKFKTVSEILTAADAELATHGTAWSGDEWRAAMEALKNVLDKANNNMNFVQATACPFTFE